MIEGLSKLAVVGLCYLLIYAAELTFNSDLYYAACSAAFSVVCLSSSMLGVIFKSKLLMTYGAICLVASILNVIMIFNSGFHALEWIYWDALINFGLVLYALEWVIIVQGGVNVICSFFGLRDADRSGDTNFDARMGLH